MESLKSPRIKRSVRLACHLTPEEFDRFSEICMHAGLTLSTATRVLIFRAIAEGRIDLPPLKSSERKSVESESATVSKG